MPRRVAHTATIFPDSHVEKERSLRLADRPDAHPEAEVTEGEGEPAYSEAPSGWRLG
jgi:hypothetical protein